MVRRFLSVAIACLYLFTLSCTSAKDVPPDKVRIGGDHIIAVVLKTGQFIWFDGKGGRLDGESQEIRGTTRADERVAIPLADVSSATVERTDPATFVAIGLVAVFFAIILIAASGDDEPEQSTSGSSCPYVYSFDGGRYVLDAEPLSGAISKGLERSDLCRLEHLRAHDGRYEVLVRNELEETQYLDQVKLRIVEHPQGSHAYVDLDGAVRVIADPLRATDARDEAGIDLRALVDAPDHIPWQSAMPRDAAWRDVPLRHELTFSFPKPAGASEGSLVVGAATSLWGSIMMREMMQARGVRLAEWRRSIDAGGPAMEEMVRFNTREELYFLKLYLLEGDRWVQRGWIPGGGPMAAETRVIPLDLSGVTGDTVVMRVAPPRGYWAFDYLAMSYGELPASRVTDVPLDRAVVGDGGGDVTPSLSEADGAYHEMKHVGDAMVLTFAAPQAPAQGTRTVFLDTRGYYHSHIDETQPEQSALIAEMLENDGAIVRHSLQKFVEYVNQTASSR